MAKNNGIPDLSSDLAKTILSIISVIILIFVMISIGRLGTAYGVYVSVYAWAHSSIGLDHYPAIAASAVLSGIILLCIPYVIWFFLFGKRRNVAIILIAGSTALIALITHFAGKDVRFNRSTGEAIKYYADTPEGRVTSESPGYDPKYGTPYKPYTPEAAAKEKGPSNDDIRRDSELRTAIERARRQEQISVLLESMEFNNRDREQLEHLSGILPNDQLDRMRVDLKRLPDRKEDRSDYDREVSSIIKKYSDAFDDWLEQETKKGNKQ